MFSFVELLLLQTWQWSFSELFQIRISCLYVHEGWKTWHWKILQFPWICPDNTVIDWFNTCDLVCVPSRNEPFGIVVLEPGMKKTCSCKRRSCPRGEFQGRSYCS